MRGRGGPGVVRERQGAVMLSLNSSSLSSLRGQVLEVEPQGERGAHRWGGNGVEGLGKVGKGQEDVKYSLFSAPCHSF